MGRAVRARRMRPSSTSTSSRPALSPGPRRPAGPASSPSFRHFLARLPRAAARLVLAALLLAGAAGLATPAFAQQSPTPFVSNLDQGSGANSIRTVDRAQAFTTGTDSAGYMLTSVEVHSSDPEGDDFSVSVCTVDANTHPTSTCTSLTPPASFSAGPMSFTAPSNTSLDANTTYAVLIEQVDTGEVNLAGTTSDNEDAGKAAGWSIANHSLRATNTGWSNEVSNVNLRIAILGPRVPIPVLDKTAITLDEGGTAQYTVKLDASPPATGVTSVRIVSDDEGAATVNPDSLSFTTSTWSTAQEVTVTGVEDRDVQDETVTLAHSVVYTDPDSLRETTLWTGAATVTVNDDDDPAIVVSKESVDLDEGGTGTYTVRLDVRPNESVTVNIASGDTAVATVAPASITFTTSSWNVQRDVTVTGVQDGDSDGETATITHSATGLEDVEVGVTVNDDESGACPSGQPASAFWKACLTVAKNALGFYGFEAGLSGTLSDDDFTFRGENISISKLTYEASNGLELDFTEDLKGSTDMVLQVGSTSLNVPAGTNEFTWSTPGFTWGDTNVGDKVSVSLRLKENTDVDVTAPVLQSATIDGTKLVLTYDERLPSESGNVDAGAFTVEVSGRDQPLTGSTDLVDVAVDGTRVIVTLAGAVGPNDRVTVSYNRVLGAAGRIRDLSGNLAASFFDRSVKNLGNWSGSPVLHVEVDEGGSVTFEWTPPGTPTEQLPVKLSLVQHSGTSPAIDLASSKQTLTSKTPGRFKLYGVHDDDWKDEVVHLSVFARRGEGRFRHIGMVNVTVRDDDGVAPGGSGGCAAATGSPFWSACMRVGSGSGDKGFEGLRPWQAQSSTSPPFGGLSKATVEKDGTHVIDGIVDHGSGNGGLSVSFAADPRPVANSWVVRLGSRIFSFSDAGYYHLPRNGALRVSHTHSYHWNYGSNESGQGWSGGDKVTVSLFDFPKPTGVSAAPGDRQATLTWTAPSAPSGLGAISDYEIRVCRGAVSECPEYTPHGTPPPYWEFATGATTASGTVTRHAGGIDEDGRLENGVTYTVQVRAVTATGKGGWSDRLQFVPVGTLQVLQPAAPRITGVTPGGLEATLAWEMPEAVEGITGWQLRYGELDRNTFTVDDWGEWTDLAGAGADARSYTVTGLSAGTDYGVELRAMVGALAGAASGTDYISGVLLALSGLAAAPGDGAVALSWPAPSFTDEMGSWQVRWKAADAAAWGDWTDIAGATAASTAHTVTGLDNGTRYALRVRAIAINGEPLAESAAVEAWAGGPPAPGAPALLAEAGVGKVTLTWTAPESVEPITGWQLRHGPTGAEEGETASEDAEPDWGEWTDIEDATAATAEHTVTGLVNGTEYAFELRALAGALVGEASVRRLARPDEEEIPPFGDSAVSSVTATTVGLEWTLPEMPEGMAATRLRAMQREKGATGEWQAWQDAAELSVDATSTTVTGLSPATLYQFRIVVETARQSADSGLLQQQTRAFDPLDTRMAGTVPDSDDGTLREGPPAQGCRVDVELRFLDADGNAVAVDALAATDFTVENGRVGTPVADADGLSWTVPARATTNDRGLVRVRLTETGRWRAAEQVFHNHGAGVCAAAARGELATLRVEELSISPDFASTTTNYTAETTDADAEVVAEAIYADATVTVAPVDADEEADGHQLALAEGETGVTVTVTPGDGSAAQTYTVTVTREATAEVLAGFVLVDASTDADLGAVSDGGTVTVSANGSYGIRAETQAGAQVGSVVLSLAGPGETDTHAQTESIAPYSLYGDAPGGANGRAEHGRALAAGSYTLTATAYALSGGAGEALGTLTAAFTVAVETAPPSAGVLTGFTLVDASDQTTVAALANGADIDLDGRSGGSFAIRADVAPNATVGSVALSLSGAKTVSRTENHAPWSLWGDRDDGNGGRALDGASLPAGTYTLSATAHAERGASGSTLGTLSVSFEVLAPAALSVADAQIQEGPGATLDFTVTLDRSSTGTVTVGYATADGTATAGSDYTATSGTLTFAPGDREKTVSVPVLEDDHDEGSETLTLRLTHVQGARIADGEATGTITNSDAIPEAWLARFGRTVTGQVLDAVEARLAAPRVAGAEASLAGQALPSWRGGDAAANDNASAESFPAEAEDRAALASMTAWLAQAGPDGRGTAGLGAYGDDGGLEPQSHALTQRDLIVGTSFALTGGSAEGGGFVSLWGQGSIAGFDGREGSLTVDGEVTTGLLGADFASERWTAGLAVGHSAGTGGWRKGGTCELNCGGAIEATLSGLYPYAGLDLTERLSVWAAAGHGSGEVTVTPEAPGGGNGTSMTADLTMSMGAAGMRGEVLRPESGDGLALALKGDARFTRTSSDAVRSRAGNLEAADADVWLVRAGIEGSRRFGLGPADDGASVTPSFELGLRRDGGDAETGLGADMGGGLAFADPRHGLVFDARARALVAHEAEGFREWGASLSGSWNPSPETDRGLSVSLTQSWGASPSGGMDALLGRETLVGLAPVDGEDGGDGFRASRRLEGELGYGLAMFGGAVTGTPNLGLGLSEGAREWRIGWRLAPAGAGASGFEMSLDATRSEPAGGDAAPEHGVMLRGSLRW